ncbi:antibiotic biosynthesis monooxygenase [Nonomuraea sp. NPDC050680]|uniref:putative quinol monooxygenase n=1 Tax=Nonomuraea sp. NPDC050680 TaxID=3154630 RepID=UPI0033C9D993
MSAFVFANRLQVKDGRRDEFIELLREFAVSMHAKPGCVHLHARQTRVRPLLDSQACRGRAHTTVR